VNKVAFIGTGVMGSSMASHLMDAGYSLTIHNRSRDRAQPLVSRGAAWADTPADAAREAEVVITIVGYPRDVEEVYFGSDGAEGIVAAARPGSCLVDMTTSEPSLARRISEAAAQRGVRALDAPVSGGDVGARNAMLTIMVGGEPDAFAAVEQLLHVMGRSVILQGGPGAGQHTKMANQIAIASGMVAACEALAYAQAAGLDPRLVLESIGAGSAGSWTLSNLAPRMLAGDFAAGFYVKHFIKDMRIALAEASANGLRLPGLELAERMYEQLADHGAADLGTQALYKLYMPDDGPDAA
jgi:3-hydroxyisobutyrate dehydrogenase